MVIYFNADFELVKKLLKSTIRLISFCQKNAEELAKSGDLNGIIQNKLLNLQTKKINYGKEDDKKFSLQQLFFLEIFLKIDELWKQVNEEFGIKIGKVLEESADISKIKKFKQILKEKDKFDLQLYLQHL
jgi:hypothetical protein